MGDFVCGVGIYHKGKYASKVNYKRTKEYQTWKGMLERCYSGITQVNQPSYVGCTVSENFKNFQYFAEWCNQQIGFGNKGWQLDKDILFTGNKIYSEDNCVFVPQEVNLLMRTGQRGLYPTGVHYDVRCKRFRARCVDGTKVFDTYHRTLEDAVSSYKSTKVKIVKEIAERYKECICPRLYEVLSKYE